MLIGIFYSQIVESSSLVSVLFQEVFSHPYISFFHLLVNGFSVTCIYIYIAIMQLQLEASYPVHGIERISVVLSVSFFTISLKGVRVSQ